MFTNLVKLNVILNLHSLTHTHTLFALLAKKSFTSLGRKTFDRKTFDRRGIQTLCQLIDYWQNATVIAVSIKHRDSKMLSA